MLAATNDAKLVDVDEGVRVPGLAVARGDFVLVAPSPNPRPPDGATVEVKDGAGELAGPVAGPFRENPPPLESELPNLVPAVAIE